MDHQINWTAGYVTELEYVHAYNRELCPGMLRLVCLVAGVAPPPLRQLRYLELGYGQGLSINIHAAAFPGEFWGTDFNPPQAAHARALGDAAGSGARLLDDSFAEFAARSELPEFDIIGLHGIWTWISDDNCRVIVDIIRRKLRVGGILYISYNCLPGWAASVPLRHLMKLHGDLAAESNGMLAKLDGALTFVKQVIDSGAVYFRGNPAVAERLKVMSSLNRNYLVHEYFTQDWRAMPFSEVVKWLDDAKVTFVASADLMDHVLNLPPEAQKLLSEIKHPILLQTVRDYIVNQQFRRDIFVKGPQRLHPLEQLEALRSEAFVLTTHPNEVPMKIKGNIADATLREELYRPLIEALADESYSPKTIEQLSASEKLKYLQFPQLLQMVLLLIAAEHAHPVEIGDNKSRSSCHALNNYIIRRARSSGEIGFMASPLTGGGVPVERFHQLFLLALQQGNQTPAELATFVSSFTQGQRIVKDAQALESAEALAELENVAHYFTTKRLPILKSLNVV
jgi:SAM-dependent methyltransferase